MEWAEYWLTRDPEELIDFDDTRHLDHLQDNARVVHIVSAEQRMTRKGKPWWLLREANYTRHYLFAEKIEDRSPFYWEWHWREMAYNQLKQRTATGSIRFDPPIPMYVMPNKGFSHVYALVPG